MRQKMWLATLLTFGVTLPAGAQIIQGQMIVRGAEMS
jgi:hypothetical protein